jgi:hypothetical protein
MMGAIMGMGSAGAGGRGKEDTTYAKINKADY